jgi:FAD synthetase
LAASVKEVDAAVLGSETNIFETVGFFEPDIIALGYDQVHSEDFIDKEARRLGIPVKVVRLSSSIPEAKTSKIFSDEKSKSEILRET